ncbi:MAG: 5'-nucleotidase C-terminal domain-containing protein [Spirochaetales bacterium]|nr:5'-nucleotidase C-terminal domain-containing protein [Spirochaetales bacterium]
MKRIFLISILILAVFLSSCVTPGESTKSTKSTTTQAAQPAQTAQTKAVQPAPKVEKIAEKVVEVEPAGGNGTLVVLHTNDHHGHPLSFFEYPAPGQGGLPARATLINQIRDANANVLVLDAGDINTGRPESMFFDAEPDIVGYNYIGYDAAALGNHEFDKPHSVLKKQMGWADFPFLSANVKYKNGGYVAKPYIVKVYDGFRVGIFGLTTTEINEIAGDVETVKDLVIEDEVKAAREMVDILINKEKVDVIIAIAHLGNYNNNESGSRYVAANVPEIDLIIDGHTHSSDIKSSGHWDMKEPFLENGVPIVITQEWGLKLGKAVFEIEDGDVVSLDWELIPVNLKKRVDGEIEFITTEIEEDPELLALLQPFADKVDALLSVEIGTAAEQFSSENVRISETAVGDLVADAMLWKTKSMGAQFAIVNSGGIRSSIPEGKITKKDIYSCVPYDNSVFILTMSGTEILELFETIGMVKQGKGGFPQVSSGVNFTFDAGSGVVTDILIEGKPVDPAGTYKVSTNSFLAGGGDGYSVFRKAANRYDTSLFQRDVLIEYIQSMEQPIKPMTYDRFEVINGVSMIDYFDTAA